MRANFDAYHQWLGIPPQEQPPSHYRLLGLANLEADAAVIERAADRQMAYLRRLQTSPQRSECQRLLNEVSAARGCLLDPAKKAAYDQRLRGAGSGRQTGHQATPVSPPSAKPIQRPPAQYQSPPIPLGPPPSRVSTSPIVPAPIAVPPRSSPTNLTPRPGRWRKLGSILKTLLILLHFAWLVLMVVAFSPLVVERFHRRGSTESTAVAPRSMSTGKPVTPVKNAPVLVVQPIETERQRPENRVASMRNEDPANDLLFDFDSDRLAPSAAMRGRFE